MGRDDVDRDEAVPFFEFILNLFFRLYFLINKPFFSFSSIAGTWHNQQLKNQVFHIRRLKLKKNELK
jgi:hypothetical protein